MVLSWPIFADWLIIFLPKLCVVLPTKLRSPIYVMRENFSFRMGEGGGGPPRFYFV